MKIKDCYDKAGKSACHKNLFALFLLIGCMHFHASGMAQNITLNVQRAPMETVLQKVEAKSDYLFFFEKDLLKDAKPVTINAKNLTINEFLKEILHDQPFDFMIEGRVIIMLPKSPTPQTNNAKYKDTSKVIPAVHGRVINEHGDPVSGVTVTVKGAGAATSTDAEGKFALKNVDENASLLLTGVSIETLEILLKGRSNILVNVRTKVTALDNVTVTISTGYYSLPRERATGSFEHADNKLLNRSVGPDILSRLDGVTSGVQFVTPNGTNASDIRVRGLSTIESDETPLIVLDNFPYEGDISNINPNDVESVTVLRDAAASSIWGARAGNGVIVITTKKGHYGQRPRVSVNSNVTIAGKPDIFYSRSRLPSATVMQIEREIFENGGFATSESTPLPAYIEMLINLQNGQITGEEFSRREAAMRNTEIRQEVMDHLYRNEVSQQYALSASGGADAYSYHLSLGYDRRNATRIGDQNDRINLRFLNSFRPLQKLEVSAGIRYSRQRRQSNGLDLSDVSVSNNWLTNQYMPLQDDQGRALPIVKGYRLDYVSTAMQQGLLDWYYRPLDELHLTDRRTSASELLINADINYQLFPGIRLAAQYQYTVTNSGGTTHYKPESYHVRNLVNRFTQDDGTRIIPYGGILEGDNPGEMNSHFLRLQTNVDRSFGKHELYGLLGAEIRHSISDIYQGFRIYEFDDDLFVGTNRFDYETRYNTRPSGRARIPDISATRRQLTDRYLSYFGNAAYSYDGRYLASASIRWDGSNLFGVKTNQKGKLLWSLGASWDVGREDFYHVAALPLLRLRATYGSSGNVNKGVSHHPVITISENSVSNLMTAYVTSIGNPSLRWEQVNTLNLALDYGFAGRRISGSVEYYVKNAKDLIGNDFIPPSTGVQGDYKINYANLRTKGIDVRLTTENLRGALGWTTTVLFSYVGNKITHYNTRDVDGVVYYISETPPPTVGRSRDAIFALPWYGLDGGTGMPIAYLDGEKTTDYAAYYNGLTPDHLLIAGVTVPPFYGSLRNDFKWKGWAIGVLLTGKAGHSFRRTSIAPGEEFYGLYHMDYFDRWKKPGDERFTNVPAAAPFGVDFPLLNAAYGFTEALIESGAHIRLQDINLSFSLNGEQLKKLQLKLESIRIYAYARNLGIVWKQNKRGIDPDFANAEFRTPKSIAFGIQIGF